MPNIIILSRDADEYRKQIEKAKLPELNITSDYTQATIALGEPKLIRDALPNLSQVKWVQAIYAGVEPLVDTAQRRDYVLTNARGIFGELMSEYVFGYLLFLEKRMLDRIQAQQVREWRRTEAGMLRGRIIGLLGVGSIGAHLAGTAKHFGMKVRGYTRESETSTQVDRYYHPSPQPSPGGRRRTCAHHGRVSGRVGHDQGREEVRRQLRRDGALQEPGLRRTYPAARAVQRGHFYAQYTVNERSDGLVSMSMDGKVNWRTEEAPPFVRGGAILADGLLLATDGNTMVYLIEPSPTAFKPLASAELLEPGENWAPLALADGKLLIRGHKEVKCLQVSE